LLANKKGKPIIGFSRTLMENIPVVFLYHPFVNFYVDNNISEWEKYTFNVWDRFIDFSNWKKVSLN